MQLFRFLCVGRLVFRLGHFCAVLFFWDYSNNYVPVRPIIAWVLEKPVIHFQASPMVSWGKNLDSFVAISWISPQPPSFPRRSIFGKTEKTSTLKRTYFCTPLFFRMIIQTQNPRTHIESTNATSCANIFAPFCVFKKRNRFFSVAFFGLYGGAGVLSFGQKCKNVRLYVPSSVLGRG